MVLVSDINTDQSTSEKGMIIMKALHQDITFESALDSIAR